MSPTLDDIRLYDEAVPTLTDDTYEIRVRHEIEGVADANVPDQSQRVVVRGPRFSLPAGEVYGVFPPENASGHYALKLPHAVLARRVLPWERGLRGLSGVPWVALLVLREDEVSGGDPKSATRSLSSKVSDVFDESDPSILRPEIPLASISDEEKQATCQTVIVDGTALQRVLPAAAELPYLAHCREVTGEHKELAGSYAVVIGNRFPWVQDLPGAASGRNLVHLVSLEGFERYLGASPPAIPAGTKVRLFSLASWSFTCLPEGGQTFSGLVRNLAAPGDAAPDRLMLRLPVQPPADTTTPAGVAQDYLARGYVALNYEPRTGEATFAMYRGPLAPEIPGTVSMAGFSPDSGALRPTGSFQTAAAATIYDPRIGAFDLSLAAGWQIGRSLALADPHFSARLLDFRRKGHAVVDMLHEYLAYAGLDTPDAYQKLVHPNLIQDSFLDLLRQGLLADVGTVANGPARPAAGATQTRESTDPVAVLRGLLGRAETQALVGQAVSEDLEPVAEWLARLKLLYDVPFHHLVPDPRMLPAESLRFFYLDYNWVEAMVDGALSTAVHTSRDALYQEVMRDVIGAAVDLRTLQMRARLQGKSIDESTPATDTDQPTAGLLVRSALVSGWPGLTVRPSRGGAPLPLLRMERLSPEVLLCLSLGVPDGVTVAEPQEGLQFGVDDKGRLDLRHTTGDATGAETGEKLPLYDPSALRPLDAYLRPGSDRVLKIRAADGRDASLVGDLRARVGDLTPSGFALQMISAPEQITFK